VSDSGNQDKIIQFPVGRKANGGTKSCSMCGGSWNGSTRLVRGFLVRGCCGGPYNPQHPTHPIRRVLVHPDLSLSGKLGVLNQGESMSGGGYDDLVDVVRIDPLSEADRQVIVSGLRARMEGRPDWVCAFLQPIIDKIERGPVYVIRRSSVVTFSIGQVDF